MLFFVFSHLFLPFLVVLVFGPPSERHARTYHALFTLSLLNVRVGGGGLVSLFGFSVGLVLSFEDETSFKECVV